LPWGSSGQLIIIEGFPMKCMRYGGASWVECGSDGGRRTCNFGSPSYHLSARRSSLSLPRFLGQIRWYRANPHCRRNENVRPSLTDHTCAKCEQRKRGV